MAKSLEEIQLAFKAQYQKTDEKLSDKEVDRKKDQEQAQNQENKPEQGKEPEQEKESEQDQDEGQDPEEVVNEKRQELEKEMKVIEGKKQRKISIISDIIFYVTLVLMVMFAFLFSQGAMGNGTLGGFRIYEVLTTSMESVYPRGSLIIVKQTAPNELVVGDDIAFVAKGNNLVTHRIIEIIDNHEVSGNRAFITKGVDNAVADADIVLAENVVGKVIKGIPRLGAMIRWSGENLWVIVLFFLSLMAFSFFLKMFWRNSKEISSQKSKRQEIEERVITTEKETEEE